MPPVRACKEGAPIRRSPLNTCRAVYLGSLGFMPGSTRPIDCIPSGFGPEWYSPPFSSIPFLPFPDSILISGKPEESREDKVFAEQMFAHSRTRDLSCTFGVAYTGPASLSGDCSDFIALLSVSGLVSALPPSLSPRTAPLYQVRFRCSCMGSQSAFGDPGILKPCECGGAQPDHIFLVPPDGSGGTAPHSFRISVVYELSRRPIPRLSLIVLLSPLSRDRW